MEPAKSFGELASNFKSLIEDFANLSREKLLSRMGSELDLLRGYMDELKLQAHLGQKEARDQAQPLLDEVQKRYDESRRKLDQLREGSGGAVNDIQDGLKRSVQDLRDALRHAAERIR